MEDLLSDEMIGIFWLLGFTPLWFITVISGDYSRWWLTLPLIGGWLLFGRRKEV